MAKISIVVRIAVAKAKGVTIQKEVEIPNTKITIAPKPAPAEIPSNPGSARLFRRSDWRIIPEAERANPMAAEFSTLGSRISRITFFTTSLSVLKIPIISKNEMFILPSATETIIDIKNIILSASRMVNFFFKKNV